MAAHQPRQESEQRYWNLFAEMREGFALHEIICDEQGKPVTIVLSTPTPHSRN